MRCPTFVDDLAGLQPGAYQSARYHARHFRIDYPFYKEGVGHAAVGALGQASLPYNYFERPQYRNFSFAEGFDVYTYRMENVPFYNLKRPYFHFMYLESGQKKFREENSA